MAENSSKRVFPADIFAEDNDKWSWSASTKSVPNYAALRKATKEETSSSSSSENESAFRSDSNSNKRSFRKRSSSNSENPLEEGSLSPRASHERVLPPSMYDDDARSASPSTYEKDLRLTSSFHLPPREPSPPLPSPKKESPPPRPEPSTSRTKKSSRRSRSRSPPNRRNRSRYSDREQKHHSSKRSRSRSRGKRSRSRDSRGPRGRRSGSRDSRRRSHSRSKSYDRRRYRSSSRDRYRRKRYSRSRSRSRDRSKGRSGSGNRKSGSLPLCAPGGAMTPQMALQQTMAAMNAKAQALTGIALPKYYNPAAVNPLKYAEQVQKRKLLWQTPQKVEEQGKSSVWDKLTFAQDQDGKMTAKFRKLMGIKSDTPNPQEEGGNVLQKQEELFRDLDQQYEMARMTTHTQRGVGLGYAPLQNPLYPPLQKQ